jgi:hypothetical protein
MRGLFWILGLAVIGAAALFYAWRLVPPQIRAGAQPTQTQPASTPAPAEPSRALVEPVASAPRSEAELPAEVAPELPPPPQPDGLEEGGLTQAARPLPDFSAKYATALRSDKYLASKDLELAVEAARKALSKDERADLDARLANEPRAAPPTPGVAALLAQIDELEWLRQQLALPREQQL